MTRRKDMEKFHCTVDEIKERFFDEIKLYQAGVRSENTKQCMEN